MRGPPPREAGLRGGGVSWVPRTRRGCGPVEGPPDGARTRRGHLRLDKLDPLLLGGQAHDPLALALPLFSARSHPVLHKSARPAAPLYLPPPKGAPRGRGLKPCVAFYFFFAFGRENSVRFCPIYVSTREQTLVVCVCVFLCWFFLKKWEEKTPFPCSPPPPFCPSDTPTPALFFFPVLFCYESTFLFVILGSPGFLFSVKSPYASSALRLLFPRSGPYGLGGAWPVPLSRLIPSSLRPSAEEGEWEREWEREREREGERASGTLRSSDGRRAPSRRFWALGRLMSGLGGGRWRLQPAFGISEPRVSLWGGVTAGCKGDCPRPRQERKGRNFQLPAPLSL